MDDARMMELKHLVAAALARFGVDAVAEVQAELAQFNLTPEQIDELFGVEAAAKPKARRR